MVGVERVCCYRCYEEFPKKGKEDTVCRPAEPELHTAARESKHAGPSQGGGRATGQNRRRRSGGMAPAGRSSPPSAASGRLTPSTRRVRRILCSGSSAYCQIATFERSARVPHVTHAQESLRRTRSVYSPRASRRKPRAFRPSRGCSRCDKNTTVKR